MVSNSFDKSGGYIQNGKHSLDKSEGNIQNGKL